MHMQCITAKHVPLTSTFYLDLQQCKDNNKLQKWIFQTDNKNPDIIENNPEISIHDMEEWRLEESYALTTTINSPIFGGLLHVNQGKGNIVWDLINWGLLKTKDQTKTKCVTYHGVGKVLTLETCDPNWTQCQGALEKHLTSIDPLINTQTSVANCSGEAKVRQALEYASDFTIRPFNTNFCIRANSTMVVLETCAETSTIWGTFNHTGQLMATDRSGLKSKAINRKCLTTKSGKLGLDHCHAGKKKQHFSFEYKNPYQPKSLSAAAIIAWNTNETSSLVEKSEIPPLKRRDNNNNITNTITETDTSTTYSPTIAGPAGPIGPPGPKGQAGQQGTTGLSGQKGDRGNPGYNGIPGRFGPQGPIGYTGENGPRGPTGLTGPPGVQGVHGIKGDDGLNGVPGDHGKDGKQGIKGEPGKPGTDGTNGINGPPGATGPIGPPGSVGAKGEIGSIGTPGVNGMPGEPGLNGAEGIPGASGTNGIPGLKGPKGEPGPPGVKGDTGSN